jgi:hypothetical protein
MAEQGCHQCQTGRRSARRNEGNDCLRAFDHGPRDRVFGGPGRDIAGADKGDIVRAVAVRTAEANPDCSELKLA